MILIYPVPEVGWRVPEYLFRKRPLRQDQVPDYLHNYPLTTSYAVYRKRTRSSFALLDRIEHPNLHRVYPHELLCDKQVKGRCVTHDTEKLFYRDSDHVNKFGVRMINDLIMGKIRLIDAKNAAVAAN